jgi:hypothetical protein
MKTMAFKYQRIDNLHSGSVCIIYSLLGVSNGSKRNRCARVGINGFGGTLDNISIAQVIIIDRVNGKTKVNGASLLLLGCIVNE